MLNLIPRPPSNDKNIENPKEDSSINIDAKINVNIREEVLMKILFWILGGSIFASGVHSIYNNLPPFYG